MVEEKNSMVKLEASAVTVKIKIAGIRLIFFMLIWIGQVTKITNFSQVLKWCGRRDGILDETAHET